MTCTRSTHSHSSTHNVHGHVSLLETASVWQSIILFICLLLDIFFFLHSKKRRHSQKTILKKKKAVIENYEGRGEKREWAAQRLTAFRIECNTRGLVVVLNVKYIIVSASILYHQVQSGSMRLECDARPSLVHKQERSLQFSSPSAAKCVRGHWSPV